MNMHQYPRGDRNQARDLARDVREAESHMCVCGAPLSMHEWSDDKGPMGGCPETRCTEFRIDLRVEALAGRAD